MSELHHNPSSAPRAPSWRRLLATTEGMILVAGLSLALACLVVTALLALWWPQVSAAIGSMVVANLMLGRTVALSIGYAAGHGHALVIGVNMALEAIMVLLVYPLFVFSLTMLPMPRPLRTLLARTHSAAERHHATVGRYGVIGLFLFVWFPFWMTGAAVGSAIGYLIGLRPLITLAAVLSGTFVAMLAWAWLIHSLHLRAASFGVWGSVLMVVALVLLAGLGYWLSRRGRDKAG